MKSISVVNRITWISLVLACLIQLSKSRILDANNTDTNLITLKACDHRCGSGECIDLELVCDGFVDCKDGSDETEKQCAEIACSRYGFRCNYGACISKDKVCDGITDCIDNSDEENTCSSDIDLFNNNTIRGKRQTSCDFRCDNGDCLGLEFQCDGKPDCKDGSDETKAQCGGIRCQSFLFQCKYGACIPKVKVCDGEKNCADNSDEQTPGCTTSPTSGGCSNFEFRCASGQCIDNLDTCDGIKHCTDGSDETEETCNGLICQDYLYRCAYGACVTKSARCNNITECVDGSDEAGCDAGIPTQPTPTPPTPTPPVQPPGAGCLLPAHLSNGHYTISSGADYNVNTYVNSSTSINLICKTGHIPSEVDNFFCLGNKWIPKLSLGYCTLVCPPLPSTDTYDATCNSEVCENSREGTVAKISCKPYYIYRGNRVNPFCQGGAWDPHPTPCEAECGQKIVNPEKLVINGTDALPGEYPWIVGIYNTSLTKQSHICGGTIISRFFVVTAAHCLADQGGTPYPDEYFTVVAGKYYRALNISESGVQTRKVKRMYVHEDYKGRWQKYRDDIALIEVDRFDMTPQVQLICMDWSNKWEEKDFQEDNKGVVAGWGFTQVGSTPAEVLKKLLVPYKPTDICRQFMDPDFFQQYYSSDKICAGYKDQGMSVCSGDSGGGLYFRSEPTMFYIRAVVSLSPRSESGCSSNHYALYTKVSRYLTWIEGITRRRI